MADQFFNTTRQDDRFRPSYGFEGLPVPPLLQMFATPFAQAQAGRLGMFPMGLSGRNAFDRLEDFRLSQIHARMLQQAAESDRDTYMAQLRGVAAVTGTPWDAERQRAANSLANRMIGAAPFMASAAPELLDAMSGYRGSAAVMADFAFQGARLRMDPVTGGFGLSQNSLDNILGAMQARLAYDREGGRITSLSLGETGRLFQTLQRQGMVRAVGLGDVAPDEIRRAAKDLKIDISRGVESLSDNDRQRLANDPGLSSQLRRLDSTQVVGTLKKYQDAIAAVREIFGDAGRPNAPMAELVAALNSLSAGSLGQVDPSRLNQMVRTTYNLATRSGMGMQNVAMFQEALSQQAAAMGVATPFAANATQGALAFGQAWQATGYGATPVFGQGNLDWQRAKFAQQQLAAAASPMSNQVGTLMRMEELSGGRAFKAGSAAARMVEQIRAGQPIEAMSDMEFIDAVAASGVDSYGSRGNALDMLRMRGVNSEYSFKYGGDRIARLAQRNEMIKFLERSSSSTAQMAAGRSGFSEEESQKLGRMTSEIFAAELSNMTPEQYGDPTARSERLARALQTRLAADPLGQRFVAGIGGLGEMSMLASNMFGASESNMKAFGLDGTLVNLLAQHNKTLLNTGVRSQAVAESRARLQTALAPFNRGGAMANGVQALMETSPDDPDAMARIFLRSLGVVNRDDLVGQMRGGMDLIQNDLREWQSLMKKQGESGLSTEELERMRAKERGIQDVYARNVMPFLESSGLAYRTNLKRGDFALYARQAHYLDRWRAGEGDADTARTAARAQVRLVNEQMESIALDPNFRLQFGPEAEKKLDILRDSTARLAEYAATRGKTVEDILQEKDLPKGVQEQLTRQRQSMAWFMGATGQEAGAEKPFAWIHRQVGGLDEAFKRVSGLKDKKSGAAIPMLGSLQSILTMSDDVWRSYEDVGAGDRKIIDEARKIYGTRKTELDADQEKRKALLTSSVTDAARIFGMTGDIDPENVLGAGVMSVMRSRADLASQFINRVSSLRDARSLLDSGKTQEAYELLKKAGISDTLLPSSDSRVGPLDRGDFRKILDGMPELQKAMRDEQASRETNISVNVARIEMKDDGMKISGEGTMSSGTRSSV